jgi:hypothetical protein
MSEQNIADLQDDIYARLLADEWLASVSILNQRTGVILNEVTQSLGVLNSRGGKIGACIIVLSPLASFEYPEVPGGPLDVRLMVRVLEDPLFNDDATNGTQKSGLAICKRVARILHLYTPYLMANALLPENPMIVPVDDPLAPIAYEVRFHVTEANNDAVLKTGMPQISPNGGTVPATVTLTSETGGASIYYTKDGSHPYPGNANSFLYNAPISLTQPTKLRACAFKSGEIASDVTSAQFA